MRLMRIRIRNPAQEMRLIVEGPRKADRALFFSTLCGTGMKANSCWSAVLCNRNRNRNFMSCGTGTVTCQQVGLEPEQ